MADSTDNLVPEHLRHIRGRIDQIAGDMQNMKVRLTALEGSQAATLQSLAGVNSPLDRLDARVDRTERRLELAEVQVADNPNLNEPREAP